MAEVFLQNANRIAGTIKLILFITIFWGICKLTCIGCRATGGKILIMNIKKHLHRICNNKRGLICLQVLEEKEEMKLYLPHALRPVPKRSLFRAGLISGFLEHGGANNPTMLDSFLSYVGICSDHNIDTISDWSLSFDIKYNWFVFYSSESIATLGGDTAPPLFPDKFNL